MIIGMMVESHISWQKKLITKKMLEEIIQTLEPIIRGTRIKLPTIDSISSQVMNDKKTLGGKMMFSLVDGIGTCKPKVEVTSRQLETALTQYNKVQK